MQIFFVASTSYGVGLTSVCMGLLRVFERGGLRVGFCKIVEQNHPKDTGPERSTELVRNAFGIDSPTPIPFAVAQKMLAEGRGDEVLEEGVRLFHEAAKDKDVMVVEGIVPTRKVSYAARVNAEMANSLGAEVIMVASPDDLDDQELLDRIDIHARVFNSVQGDGSVALILNKVTNPDLLDNLRKKASSLAPEQIKTIGSIPWNDEINAPRTYDVAEKLGARILHAGKMKERRVERIVLCARALVNTVELFQAHTLLVAPGDREDIIVAACLAASNGVPLAGLLLCVDHEPDPRILALCNNAIEQGLPVMLVSTGSYETATNIDRMDRQIAPDDLERAERVTEFVANNLDSEWLLSRVDEPKKRRMSPSAFRYSMVLRAQEAKKRIVLPEGNEPRTIQAAVECHEKGIARCVLLAKPEEVAAVAETKGITLPADLEIIDPDTIRKQYVAPMVELRKNRGLNEPMALAQLEDNVVLGTMMLALDDVDGLVSGALNTTANTIRPALQLIKTAPGYNLVSSVFFMLLPDQVLVYGDCAVNPDPTAPQLAEIAIQSAASAEAFGIDARVAMLSYSTGTSGMGSDVEKVLEATQIAKERAPELLVDGPLQYDAAAIESVGRQKAPDSPVAGRATVYIFPDLNTGNTTYKAVQRSTNSVSVGPMLQGLRKPVNDLSRGALVKDIVYTIALTAIQAASASEK